MIFLFHGSEPFLISLEVNKWKQSFAEKYGPDGIIRMDLETLSFTDLQAHINDGGFFQTKKMVILTGFPYPPKTPEKQIKLAEKILTLLTTIPSNPDITIVLVGPGADKRTSLYKTVEKIAHKAYLFDEKKGSEIIGLIDERTEGTLTVSDKNFLIQSCHGNIGRIWQECQKICTGKSIPGFDRKTSVYKDINASVFDFLDTLRENKEKARIIRITIRKQKNVIHQTRGGLLRGIKALLCVSRGIRHNYETKKIIRASGLTPFTVNKIVGSHRQHPLIFENILSCYNQLLDLDKDMKTGRATEEDLRVRGRHVMQKL